MGKILVTGGAGYIGAHTCKRLAAAGHEPVTIDNLSTGHRSFVKWGPLVEADILDTDALTRALREHRPEAVIHFAAKAYVGESMQDPFKYYRNNVAGSLSLLTAMRAADVRTIVFSSTCATYGVPNVDLISEDTPQEPINPYGHSKLMIEKVLQDLSKRSELSYMALRYFNAAGADPSGEIGEWHEPETHLIPLAIASALGGSPLQVFGTDFPTPDGTAIRDYVHVDDLADGHLAALEYLLAGGASDAVNLGTGMGASVREVVDGLRLLQAPVSFVDADRRPGDPAHLVADNAKAKRVLGWSPAYPEIGGILETALTWHNTFNPSRF